MPDLQQLLAGNNSPVIRRNDRKLSVQEIKDHDSSLEMGSSDVEFQIQTQSKGLDVHSPPLWKSSRVTKNEIHPLFSHNCRVLKKPAMHDIEKSKKELMDIISSLPESSYELSLKDIVRRDIMQEAEEDVLHEKKPAGVKNPKTRKMKKTYRPHELPRNGSVNETTFFLKMFIPTTVSVNNRMKGKGTKVATSRPLSGGESEHGAKEEWWKRFSTRRENIGCSRSDTSTSSRHNNSNRSNSRSACSNFLSVWWPSFHTWKSKNWCLF